MSRSCNILSHRSYLDLSRICTDEKALETVRCGLYFGPMDDVSEKFPAVHDRLKVRFAGPTKVIFICSANIFYPYAVF